MSNRSEMEAALWSILDALRAYAADVLLIGGWVPYLHLTYGRAVRGGRPDIADGGSGSRGPGKAATG